MAYYLCMQQHVRHTIPTHTRLSFNLRKNLIDSSSFRKRQKLTNLTRSSLEHLPCLCVYAFKFNPYFWFVPFFDLLSSVFDSRKCKKIMSNQNRHTEYHAMTTFKCQTESMVSLPDFGSKEINRRWTMSIVPQTL